MSRQNTPLFLARRFSTSADGESRGTMIRISIATTALSVAVMILSLAVVAGFKSELAEKVDGFMGRFRVVALAWSSEGEQPITRIESLERRIAAEPEVESVNAYAVRSGVLKSDAAVSGVMLKGVGEDFDLSFFEEHLTEGELPQLDSVRTKEVALSGSLARLLDVGVGDRVEFMFVESDTPPRRDRYRICGLYDTGFAELDKTYVLTDIRNVQRLAGWGADEVSGYEIKTRDFADVEGLDERLYLATVELECDEAPLMIIDTVADNPTIFDWLKAHDVNAVVIITIMFVVSLLSALSALLIMLLERTRTIGLLKALGMDNGAVQRVFMYRSLFIAAVGVAIGDVVGIALCLAQKHLHLISLDSEGYFLDEVPIDLGVWEVVAVDAGVVVLLMLVLMLPTLIISKIKPEKTIRYQ